MNADRPVDPQLEELWAALAEADAEQSPAGMDARVLEAALRGRRAGRPVGDLPVITPLAAFRAQVAAFDSLLGSLDGAEWHRPALRDLDVQGLVGHIVGVERDFQAALEAAGIAGSRQPRWAVGDVDHVASTQSHAVAQAGREAARTHDDWRAATAETLDLIAAAALEAPGPPVHMHGIALALDSWLVVRTFELWTHDEDVRRATGRQPAAPGESAVRLMTDLAVALLPAAMERVDGPRPAGVTRLVLTGPSGGCWSVPSGEPPGAAAARIVADTVDFCRVAAARVQPGDLEADISGDRDLAMQLLRGAFSLALD